MSTHIFVVTVEREIRVEIEDEKFTPEFIKESKECMYGFDTIEEHAEHIAQFLARFGDNDCMDGYYGMDGAYSAVVTAEDIDVEASR